MGTAREQLEALRELYRLYQVPVLLANSPASRTTSFGTRESLEEVVESYGAFDIQLRDARRSLLRTGFPVPDAWFTADFTGHVRILSPIPAVEPPWEVEYGGPDLDGVKRVLAEIAIAVERLKAAPDQQPTGGLIDPDRVITCRSAADLYKVPYAKLRARLDRWRKKHPDEVKEVSDPRRNEPRFLFPLAVVVPIARDLVESECRKARASERASKK